MEDTLSAFFDALADAVAERVLQKMHGVKETYTVNELAERYGCSACTIRRKIAAGEFGTPVKLGERTQVIPAEGVRQFENAHAERTARRQVKSSARRRSVRSEPGPI